MFFAAARWRTVDAPGGSDREVVAPVLPDDDGTELVGAVEGAVLDALPPGAATKGLGPRGPVDGLVDPPVVAPWPLDVTGAVVDGDGGVVVGGGFGGTVVVVDAGHSVAASEGERGGGSDGVALPSGSKRQPSTSPTETGHEAGPTLAYVHDEPPWK